jgi:carboxyl-terminal processing protease
MGERVNKYRSEERVSKRRKPSVMQPLIFAMVLIVGIFIGSRLGDDAIFLSPHAQEDNPNKLVKIINYIENNYVDSVQKAELIDGAIAAILENLDPHSYYISSEEYAAVQEQMQGNFEGIGVEFMIQNDTLVVVTPLTGGPSEEAGIEPGDQIITVDGDTLSGTNLTNEKVMKSLKGEKGTEVNIGVKRRGQNDLLYFDLVRDKIPIHSVVASFNVAPEVGYVKVTRFARTTFEEFFDAVADLQQQGAKKLILDLRGNGGGFLDQATDMVDEFIEKGELIVYTQGKSVEPTYTKSRKNGRFRDMELVVLINQGSASASEVVTGALQDHDRAIAVGRRSFGKGLVQHELPLPDNSALRLTVARYYTPSGRCIQKPYGDGIDYHNDYHDRLVSGELLTADSISFPDSLKFETTAGRIVYGGGGITPDIFVPIDTTSGGSYFGELVYGGLLREFGFNYVDDHRDELVFADMIDFNDNFEVSEELIAELVAVATEDGIPENLQGLEMDRADISNRLKAHMAKNLFEDEAFYFIGLQHDPEFLKALDVVLDYKQYFASTFEVGNQQ